MTDPNVKTESSATDMDEKKASPLAGMFGFAGPTRFHPGKMPERRESAAVRLDADLPDDTGGHSAPD